MRRGHAKDRPPCLERKKASLMGRCKTCGRDLVQWRKSSRKVMWTVTRTH